MRRADPTTLEFVPIAAIGDLIDEYVDEFEERCCQQCFHNYKRRRCDSMGRCPQSRCGSKFYHVATVKHQSVCLKRSRMGGFLPSSPVMQPGDSLVYHRNGVSEFISNSDRK